MELYTTVIIHRIWRGGILTNGSDGTGNSFHSQLGPVILAC